MRALRLERRQTQQEFWAGFLGLSGDFGSFIERGINAPSFETIETICTSLGLTEAELFTFSEQMSAVNRRRVKKTETEKLASRKARRRQNRS
jgi:transcriptional regulator with XRE-family HTH domain